MQKPGQGKRHNKFCSTPCTLGLPAHASSARAVGQAEGAVTAVLLTGTYPSWFFYSAGIFYAAPCSSPIPALAVRGTGLCSPLPVLLYTATAWSDVKSFTLQDI